MESQTNMLPWIVKQSQKGPPDAYFGYIPPAREPKKILGVFKVKPKVREELPQQKLGIDISRISTPLHHQTSRNSVLSPNEYLSKPNESDTALEKPNAPIQQPVSILKKTKSNPNYNDDYMNAPIVEDDGESYRQYRRPIMHRSSRSSLYSQRTMTPQHYPEDFYYRPRGYYYDPRDDYRDEYRDNDRHRYDDVEEYDSQDEEVERRGYYGTTMKMTPLRMEEWENALDTLCDEFPRLDRMYLNDFLRSTRGDFISAKNMVLEMIMENRRPLF
jgi:hypothetical protein